MTEGEGKDRVSGSCLTEEALVEYVDETLPGPASRHGRGALERPHTGTAGPATAEHLAGCEECRARLDVFAERDRAVRAWIQLNDPEPPPREAYRLSGPGAVRSGAPVRLARRVAAAAAVLVLAAGALSGSLRELVRDGWQAITGGPPTAEPAAREQDLDEDTPGEATPATSFVPDGVELVISFTHPETRGRLTIVPSIDARVTVRAPAGVAGLSIEPGAVTVGNVDRPEGDYQITVPATIRALRLRLPGAGDRVIEVAGLASETTVPLVPGG